MKPILRLLVLVAALASTDALADTFTVTVTNDTGPGSLRQAILDSNNHPSGSNNVIAFGLPGEGIRIINLLSPLPAFTQPATLDGFTQAGASPNTLSNGNNANLLVELDGSALNFNQAALRLNLPGVGMRGLRVARCKGSAITLTSSNCLIAGSLIYSNGDAGIYMTGTRNIIGGTTPATRNVLSENLSYGIGIEGEGAHDNQILGNFIGPNLDGGPGTGRQYIGIQVFSASDNVFGSTNAGAANVIAYNGYFGLLLISGTNNGVRGNFIFDNPGIGIDLASTGVTPNDPGDGDEGPNHLQNYPELTNVVASGGSTLIQGRLNSRPNTTYVLDFYTSRECTFAGYGPGEFYLGSADVTTDSGGDVDFSITVPATIQARVITATATDPAGNTSEFSACVEPSSVTLPPQTYVVLNTNDSGPGSLRQALLDVDLLPATGPDRIHFNIPGSGVQIIQPFTPLPTPAEPVIIDGSTQPGAGGGSEILIQLDGSVLSYGSGLDLTSGGCTVRNLSITRFPDYGLSLSGGDNTIKGNLVGVEPSGAGAGNLSGGILLEGAGNMIGGLPPDAGNVISANAGDGLVIVNTLSSNNVVQGNLIGTDATGSNVLGNAGEGIYLYNAPNNLIGGNLPGTANVVAGNTENGIRLEGTPSFGNRVEGNFIGTDSNLVFDLGNLANGILITRNAHNNTIGGDDLAAGNWISNNKDNGVNVESGSETAVLGNNFANNAQKPIAVAPGANANVQPPTLDSAYRIFGKSGFTTEGRVTGMPNTTYRVQLYHVFRNVPNPQNLSGIEERFVAAFTVTTDEIGTGSFIHHTDWVNPYFSEVSATITCTNNTSELSGPIYIKREGTVDLAVTMDLPAPLQQGITATVSNSVANTGPADALNVQAHQILPPGSAFISADSADGSCTFNNGVVTCDLGSLTNRQTKTFTVTARFDLPGLNETTLIGAALGQQEGLIFDNQDRQVIYVFPSSPGADLAVSIVGFHTNELDGQAVPVTITVTNRGPATAHAVQVVMDYDAGGVELNLGTPTIGAAEKDQPLVRWQIDDLPPNGSAQLPLTVTFSYSPAHHGEHSFQVRVLSETPDPMVENNRAIGGIYYVSPPTLSHRVEPEKIILVFRTNSPNSRFEVATNLEPPIVWQPWTGDRVVSNGQVRVTVSTLPPPDQRFFRLNSTSPPPVLPDLKLSQLDLSLDGVRHPFSDWGLAEVTFIGQSDVQYLNLNLDGVWAAQNVPLLSQQGSGVVQTVTLGVPLGQYGTMKTEASLGWSLTTNTVPAAPPADTNAPVGSRSTIQFSGFAGSPLYYEPPEPLVGGLVVSNDMALPAFPNLEQGVNECAPTAVLNSLLYLDQGFGLNLPTNRLTIGEMKVATGWGVTGAPVVWWDDVVWVDRKREYMARHNLPIVTEETRQPSLVQSALRNHYDVEICVDGHAAAVVGVAVQTNGNWTLLLQDDLIQGAPGGLRRYPVTYDPSTGKITGSGWNTRFIEFVIERPGP